MNILCCDAFENKLQLPFYSHVINIDTQTPYVKCYDLQLLYLYTHNINFYNIHGQIKNNHCNNGVEIFRVENIFMFPLHISGLVPYMVPIRTTFQYCR